ncbi:hypothetical protein NADFUDRAFT_72111 [Nadsonia fulvescens var. elongata DSM 6958]|uniref:Uncharacterized protein n=1 Tax=Nadsonia fulvescens var. elongata DSM 6958 TaxID=857566 RepID=A0A1E3PD90_9ASCO|nr:hypothetical protein NADFUDRAFT_72111 [Nadsonia fulvescens var. elongata DSM 6958]
MPISSMYMPTPTAPTAAISASSDQYPHPPPSPSQTLKGSTESHGRLTEQSYGCSPPLLRSGSSFATGGGACTRRLIETEYAASDHESSSEDLLNTPVKVTKNSKDQQKLDNSAKSEKSEKSEKSVPGDKLKLELPSPSLSPTTSATTEPLSPTSPGMDFTGRRHTLADLKLSTYYSNLQHKLQATRDQLPTVASAHQAARQAARDIYGHFFGFSSRPCETFGNDHSRDYEQNELMQSCYDASPKSSSSDDIHKQKQELGLSPCTSLQNLTIKDSSTEPMALKPKAFPEANKTRFNPTNSAERGLVTPPSEADTSFFTSDPQSFPLRHNSEPDVDSLRDLKAQSSEIQPRINTGKSTNNHPEMNNPRRFSHESYKQDMYRSSMGGALGYGGQNNQLEKKPNDY